MHVLQRLRHDDSGATIPEYGFLLAFVALVALVSVQTIGTKLNTVFGSVAGTL